MQYQQGVGKWRLRSTLSADTLYNPNMFFIFKNVFDISKLENIS
jgi:hypothetical protein